MGTVVCIGDSLTNGRDWGNGTSPIMPLNVRLSIKYPRIRFVNLGVNGDTSAGIYSRRTDANSYSPYRIVVWAGISDINTGVSSSTIQTNLGNIYSYYSGLGYSVYALTITPRDPDDSAKNTIRNTVNTWIKTIPSGVSLVIDAFTIIADPTNTTQRNPLYAQNGDLSTPSHINDAGYQAIVDAFP